MDYLQKLKRSADQNQSILCLGLDPVLDRIPVKGKPEEAITKFLLDILQAIVDSDSKPSIVKPNIAFYEQYGLDGLRALKEVIAAYKAAGFLVLLDAKRGDIGKTSAAYAKSVFGFWGADALTVAPYMGVDSISPFTRYCSKGYGVYVLARTSNAGAKDLQDISSDNVPLYLRVAKHITESWNERGIGAVVGATYPEELERISGFFVQSGKKVPLLIPGVGSQGGSAREVIDALKKTKNDLGLHRINSSSGILYAYENAGSTDYAGAAVKEISRLNKEIDYG